MRDFTPGNFRLSAKETVAAVLSLNEMPSLFSDRNKLKEPAKEPPAGRRPVSQDHGHEHLVSDGFGVLDLGKTSS